MKCKVKFLMDTSARRLPGNYSWGTIIDGATGFAGTPGDYRFKGL
jgi:hypothetical protein